ncbi:hypothetical protein A3850_013605 [Lewinella sp. 4G2]|nr:hypothetical protein A3850_013605 [Lewinella sp. 4G2]
MTLVGCVVGAQDEVYLQQLEVIEQLLAEKNYRAAAAQSKGLANTASQAQLTELEANANYLQGKALALDPTASIEQKTAGVVLLKDAASVFRRRRMVGALDSAMAVMDKLGEVQPLANNDELNARRERRRKQLQELPSDSALTEGALQTILALQEKEITALNDSQLRQLVLLEQKDRLLDDYAFRVLEDSFELVKQDRELSLQDLRIKEERQRRNFLLLLALATIITLGSVYWRFRSSKKHAAALEERNLTIERERQRSDELLLNILPAPVARELKEQGKATAKSFASATILFVDFIGFSALSKTVSAEQLVRYLDEAFKELDRIIERHGLEKIKTIGDAYMCAGGLPVPSDDHAERCVAAALAIQNYLSTHSHFKARIGIHTGPVVAGVVGLNKFAYDVWGDTVNQAARLETAGESGKVAISETTKEEISDSYVCEEAGTFEAKNIGRMKRFFVSRTTD